VRVELGETVGRTAVQRKEDEVAKNAVRLRERNEKSDVAYQRVIRNICT
jgi:hypothetical protein